MLKVILSGIIIVNNRVVNKIYREPGFLLYLIFFILFLSSNALANIKTLSPSSISLQEHQLSKKEENFISSQKTDGNTKSEFIEVRNGMSGEASCKSKIQLTHYTPNICYYNSLGLDCVDQCLSTLPGSNPGCFMDIHLPCEIRDSLFESARSYQSFEDVSWVHISDLLNFPALMGDLHIVRRDLFQELYKSYVIPPPSEGFSESTKQVRKDNYRLLSINNAIDILYPLKSSAVFKRLSLGSAIEDSVEFEFNELLKGINQFPFFSDFEKNNLNSELILFKESELKVWGLMSLIPESVIQESRVTYLNDHLKYLAEKINTLKDSYADYLINKINNSTKLNFRRCQAGICFNEIDPHFSIYYPAVDKIHTYLELMVNNFVDEAEAFERTIDIDSISISTQEDVYPDFSGLINTKLHNFQVNPIQQNLKELEAAINVAFLQQSRDGQEIFNYLKSQSSAQIKGNSFLAPFESEQVLLCESLERIDRKLKENQQKVYEVSREATGVIAEMINRGHSLELRAKLEQLVLTLSQLSIESQRISRLNRFSLDRSVNIYWNFDSDQSEWDTKLYDIQVEYISFDGVYWSVMDSIPLMDMLPAVSNFSTIKGSLLPNANGSIAGLKTLHLSLRQSAYTACSKSNNEIKLIVSLTDQEGSSKRYALTAILDQI
ncbi:hypothetical protein ACJJH9_02965 [Microbulbifer sp. DLAB2-AF]|uniref:hypothetical protein n=1 Tax=Microbulbifer sp. DLAB2-AF TaxID=3243395 RepID=UPI004038FFDE